MSPASRTWQSPALPMGPRVPVWAPTARRVELHLPGDEALDDRLVDMVPAPDGWWTAPFNLEPGTNYAFRVDGSPDRPDPRSALQPHGVHGPSRTVDPTAWQWTDQDWMGKDLLGSVIYELHVGTFTPEGTLDSAISRLDHLAELSNAVAALSDELDRPLSLVAEADLNDVGVITPTDQEPPAATPSLGMTAQWADDVHHALHTRITGEAQAYYADFAEPGAWTKAYSSAFLHNGTWSTFRDRVWGAPVPEDTDPRRFVVFGSNHDQIGNRAVGDRPSAGLDDAALAATAALVLLSPYTPMLFMGEEWGTRTPFQFFTDHEEEDLARSVSQGRAREFAGFGWDADEIPDPQDAGTVEASRLDWSELDKTEHAHMLSWYRALTALRRELAWSQRTAWPQIDEADDVVTVTYEDIVVVTNLSGRPRPAAELSDVLLSWAPVGSDPSCLPPGQTLVARR